MANLIVPAGLAFVGGTFGGQTGAAIGWMIGSVLTNDTQTVGAQTIGDLRVQTSEYGKMIPYVINKQRIAGNIIWATDKVPTQTSTRIGKGGFSGAETVVTTYTVSMAIALCAGPIKGITRIWQDGTLKMDVNGDQPKMPRNSTLYLGDNTQLPDPVIEAHEGVGNVPAYRGISYIVLEDFDLGASGKIPFFSFEVVTESTL